ncbi:MAG: redoxin domain-containing protein [Bacteroidales bacterium]|nr:redoxin domain-containing protein [Bacteroidales bacterium]
MTAISAQILAAEKPLLPTDKLNKPITELRLTGAKAADSWTLTAQRDAPALAIVFLSFECPVSNSYIATLNDLARTYGERGLRLIGVVPGETDPAAITQWAKEFKLAFPLYADPELQAAQALKATTTPEAFVLDRHHILRYRGRIDDAYSARLKRNVRITRHDLADAIQAVLAGKTVSEPATRAVGCPVGERELRAKPGADTTITYSEKVLPILQQHCQGCHRPGQVGPFSLMTYRQAVNWAEDIRAYTQSREMPPWKPVAGPAFQNERRLTAAEIHTLSQWVDAGCPEGDPRLAPPAVVYRDEWKHGTPDLILTPDADFFLGASGQDLFRCFVLPTNLDADRYIIGYEVRPGNAQVVHHTLNFWDRTGMARQLAEQERKRKHDPNAADHGPGYSSSMGIGFIPIPPKDRPEIPAIGGFGGWAPGQQPVQLPAGNGWLLPKGADLVIQTHYHRTGKPETDRLKIGLYFSKQPIQKQWQSVTMAGIRPTLFRPAIPAGAAEHPISGSVWLRTDALVHNAMPHMHLIGKSVKITMTPPQGAKSTLVEIADWDYNWQETYWFQKPILAPAGTRFDIEAVYNNSASNPNNPFSPPKDIYFGEQTTNEMLFGFLGVTPVHAGRVRVSRTDPTQPTESDSQNRPNRNRPEQKVPR